MKNSKLAIVVLASALGGAACLEADDPQPQTGPAPVGQTPGVAQPGAVSTVATTPAAGGVQPGAMPQAGGTGAPVAGQPVATGAQTAAPPAQGQPAATTPPAGAGTGTAPAATTPPAAAGPVTCTNSDLSVIPIDETGWVARDCNNVGMQGAWYCYDDGVNPSGCTADTPPFVPGSGMCLQGNTTEDETFAAWGAGIGLSLNDAGEAGGGVKSAFDATSNGLLGFSIKITGDTGGLPIRIQFPKAENPDLSPFVEVPGASETAYEVLIADALIPEAWDQCEGDDCLADPSSVFDVQIQVVGGDEAADYNFCVESMVPITDGSTPVQQGGGGGALSNYGSEQCGAFSIIDIGPYAVQNNAYNTASHCVTARWDNGSTGGFNLTNVSANVEVGGAPASYPSLIYGWHVDGQFHGNAYTSARQLSSIGAINSSTSFTVPGAGRYNMAYDNWIKNQPTSPDDQGTLEQMIWLNYRETTPIGSSVDSVNIGGTQWDVWYGSNLGFNTVSYIRATNTTNFTMDLKAFMDDTVQRGYAQAGDYLLGIQAGFEIWEANQNFSVDSFSVSVQ